MPPKSKFVEGMEFSQGEKVLCYHGPLIYEAKCLKSTITKDKQVKYFVHYAGWSKSWDEWVPESRVLKYNEANVAKQMEVQKNAPIKGKKTKVKATKADTNISKASESRASTPGLEIVPEKKASKTKISGTPSSTSIHVEQTPEMPKKKRTKLETSAEPEDEFVSKVDINIRIPDDLKKVLVDDWDLINKQKKLWTLPAAKTVEEIVDNFVEYSKTNSKTSTFNCESSVTEIANGIKEHFNTILNTQLLYKFERQQFVEIVEEDDLQPCKMYGSAHLLRLFVRLGTNLAFTMLDEQNIQFLVDHCHEFLKYMQKHISVLFNYSESYSATPEYIKKSA